MPQQSSVDLANIFQSVTQALAENQQALNQADELNRDHGTNMVQTFQTITNALEQKKGYSASAALNYASKQLEKKTSSGSGHLYAQNLAQAAGQFKGKKVDAQGAVQLLQMLIGGGQAAQQSQAPRPSSQATGGDLLGTLLGGMTGGEMPQQQASQGSDDMLGALLGGLTGGGMQQPQQQAPQGDDMLGALLGGLTGGGMQQPQQQAPQAGGDLLGSLLGGMAGAGSSGSAGGGAASGGLQDGLGLDDLLNAGMAYFAAKQSGGSNMQALIQALLAGSGMGNSVHRNESTTIVVNTFLQALTSMGKK